MSQAQIIFIICAKQQVTASKNTEEAFYDDSSKTPFTTDTPLSYTSVKNNHTDFTLDVGQNVNLNNESIFISNDIISIKESNTEKEGNESEASLLFTAVYKKIRPTRLDSKVTQLEANAELLLENTNHSSGNDTVRRAQINYHDHKTLLKLKNILQGLFMEFFGARESKLARNIINELKKQSFFILDLLTISNEFNKLLLDIKKMAQLIRRRIIKFIIYAKNVMLQWKDDVMKKLRKLI